MSTPRFPTPPGDDSITGYLMQIYHELGQLKSAQGDHHATTRDRLQDMRTDIGLRIDRIEDRLMTMEQRPPPTEAPKPLPWWAEMKPREWVFWGVMLASSVGVLKPEVADRIFSALK